MDEQQQLRNLLADLAEVHGPATAEELAQSRAEWPDRAAQVLTVGADKL
jgi:hypothetical protein